MQHWCREYTVPRNEKETRVKGWALKNTRIGPVMDKKVCRHVVTLTSDSFPVHDRKWIDIETQRSHDPKCYEVSEAITRLLRHDQSVPRISDGAIQYSDIIEECRKQEFEDASQWSLEEKEEERRNDFNIA